MQEVFIYISLHKKKQNWVSIWKNMSKYVLHMNALLVIWKSCGTKQNWIYNISGLSHSKRLVSPTSNHYDKKKNAWYNFCSLKFVKTCFVVVFYLSWRMFPVYLGQGECICIYIYIYVYVYVYTDFFDKKACILL